MPPGAAPTMPSVSDPGVATARLRLRPLPPTAAAALPDDRPVAARILGAALAPQWPPPDLLDALPGQAAATADRARLGVWVVVETATGMVVGDMGFLGPAGAEGTVELWFGIVPDRRRRGYAGEAVRALVDWAFGQAGITAVESGCEPGNVAAVRTLEHVGFRRTGESAGRVRWRIDLPGPGGGAPVLGAPGG